MEWRADNKICTEQVNTEGKRSRGEIDQNGMPPLSLPAIPPVLHLKEILRIAPHTACTALMSLLAQLLFPIMQCNRLESLTVAFYKQ